MQRAGVQQEMEQARLDFHDLVKRASAEDLRRRTTGTRWTNRQLLFHMVFGYLIVRSLMPLAHTLGRLGWSRRFAAILNSLRRPFHLINYLGSVGGGQLLTPAAMARLMDRTVRALQRKFAVETDNSLNLIMHFPPAWDPYFQPTMSVLVLGCGALPFVDHGGQPFRYNAILGLRHSRAGGPRRAGTSSGTVMTRRLLSGPAGPRGDLSLKLGHQSASPNEEGEHATRRPRS
jgi:hypothetical protein